MRLFQSLSPPPALLAFLSRKIVPSMRRVRSLGLGPFLDVLRGRQRMSVSGSVSVVFSVRPMAVYMLEALGTAVVENFSET